MQHASGHPVTTWVADRIAEGHTGEQVQDLLRQGLCERLSETVDNYVEGVLAVRRSGR